MRIIAGTARGIRLKTVPGKNVRPTTDRVKESLFNVIGPFFSGGWALDLFAGTGALGIESLSRGIEHVIFVDQSRKSIEVIQENIRAARLEKRAEIYCSDARMALKKIKERHIKFQLIFLDPPYHKNLLIPVLDEISDFELLLEEGVIVVEYPREFVLLKTIGQLVETRRLSYGNSSISLLRKV